MKENPIGSLGLIFPIFLCLLSSFGNADFLRLGATENLRGFYFNSLHYPKVP